MVLMMHLSMMFFFFILFRISGGFAFVYVVQDANSGTEYALKRLLGSDKLACNNIIREINFLKQLSGHPNIVKYITASFIDRTQSGQGNAEYLLVTELCKGKDTMNIVAFFLHSMSTCQGFFVLSANILYWLCFCIHFPNFRCSVEMRFQLALFFQAIVLITRWIFSRLHCENNRSRKCAENILSSR